MPGRAIKLVVKLVRHQRVRYRSVTHGNVANPA